MKRILTLAALSLFAAPGLADAGGQEGTVGVGAEYQLSSILGDFGLGGASVNYDAGMFHVGGFLGFADPEGADNTAFSFGGRFYYHVHTLGSSDFGVGGTVGILHLSTGPDDSATGMFIEPGVQIRAFVAQNVALSFSVGLVIGAIDASGTAITGQPTGNAGVHYYFF